MMYNLQDEHWRIEQYIHVMMYNLQDEHWRIEQYIHVMMYIFTG